MLILLLLLLTALYITLLHTLSINSQYLQQFILQLNVSVAIWLYLFNNDGCLFGFMLDCPRPMSCSWWSLLRYSSKMLCLLPVALRSPLVRFIDLSHLLFNWAGCGGEFHGLLEYLVWLSATYLIGFSGFGWCSEGLAIDGLWLGLTEWSFLAFFSINCGTSGFSEIVQVCHSCLRSYCAEGNVLFILLNSFLIRLIK